MIRTTWLIAGCALLLLACSSNEPKPEDTPTETSTASTDASGESSPDASAQADAAAEDPSPDASGGLPAPADVTAPPEDAQVTASGLATKVLKSSDKVARPSAESVVTVHYTGWTTDGQMFDSSVMRDQPATFPLPRVIQGWREAVMLMSPGEKRRVWIPEELAYQGKPDKPAGMLVFDIELIAIESGAITPPEAEEAP